jgi:AbrB family looped-hinge helix DNA binding protein
MNVKLSSKGQLVIPKKIRQTLDLQPGTEFTIELVGRQIIIQPVVNKQKAREAIEALHGMFAGSDLLDALEAEHQWEIERDKNREQLFSA